MGDCVEHYHRDIKRNTRSLDYGSYGEDWGLAFLAIVGYHLEGPQRIMVFWGGVPPCLWKLPDVQSHVDSKRL